MKDYQFSSSLCPIKYENTYSEGDSKIITQGFLAPTMDDRWDLIYLNQELNIYRSWTGKGFFKLKFDEHSGKLIVKEALVDEEFLNNYSDEYCSKLMHWVIEFVLFGRKANLPKWNN